MTRSKADKSPILALCHCTTWPFVLEGMACHGDAGRRREDFSQERWVEKGHGE